MSIFEELSKKTLNDPYFLELYHKAEVLSASNLFGIREYTLSEKQFIDLLRFSDILSRSSNSNSQNKAYKIISLLVDDYKNNPIFRSFAESVFTKLGNFPAIKYLNEFNKKEDSQSLELVFEKIMKEEFQKTPKGDLIFTDSQYEIFERITNSNHFSFSGPTSLGKSFILNAFIYHLIFIKKCNENIIILVPTRALINQTLRQLKAEFSALENHMIISHPTVPVIYKRSFNNYIFVFTPERLISYLADSENPEIGYLFVDEAQKIIAEKDSRSPLYYHSILQAERKNIKLYFSSPNIPNPDVFLSLFEKSTDEVFSVTSSPVAQNRYFIDFIEKRCLLFSDVQEESSIQVDLNLDHFYKWLDKLSGNHGSLVYCNTKADTIEHALEFSKTRKNKEDPRINEVISVIKEHLHEKYYLIDCLKKGVAFHFGNLPQRIRTKIELLFGEKIIDYVFCTSTLLEGVNLPAKNIFILSNAIGLTKFSNIDFWNLSGRAGRLTKELSGNIICARIENKKNRWYNPETDLNVIKEKTIKPVRSLVTNGQNNFFKNIEASLTNSRFTKKNPGSKEVSIWNHYANIMLIHELRSDDSVLRCNFLKNNSKAKRILNDLQKNNRVENRILSAYSSIKARYQNDILSTCGKKLKLFTDNISYESVLDKLVFLSKVYAWETEESSGIKPMYKSSDTLKYYAVLMTNWMNSTPINRMILNSLKYYDKKGKIWERDTNKSIDFNKSQYCINLVINDIVSDIDNILRFKLKNYFGNYHELLVQKLGKKLAGPNWADYLEYGTNDYRITELQNIGIPRHLASYLLGKHQDVFTFERKQLTDMNESLLLKKMDKESTEYKELQEVL